MGGQTTFGDRSKSSGSTELKRVDARLGLGSDSVSFLKNTSDRKSTYRLEGGADSIVFGRRSSSVKSTVRLGKDDNATDTVDIHKKADVKKLKITNFGNEDVLKIGSKTLDYDQLKNRDGHVSKDITIRFD